MNNTQIEKLLNLINNNELGEAKQILKIELLKNSNNKNIKLLDVVKKYLKNADKSRPVLQTIMIKDNKQFICNGYSMYIFENYIEDFDILPNSTENILDYKQIYKNRNYQSINDYDMSILKNIKKIIAYYKQIDGIDKKNGFIIPFANKYYNANMILELCNMYQNNFDNLKIYTSENELELVQFTNDNITSIILPVRVKEEEKQLYNDRIKSCLSLIDQI